MVRQINVGGKREIAVEAVKKLGDRLGDQAILGYGNALLSRVFRMARCLLSGRSCVRITSGTLPEKAWKISLKFSHAFFTSSNHFGFRLEDC